MILSLKLLMSNVRLLHSISLMVQAEFSPVNRPLSGILLSQIEIIFDVSFN